MNFYSCRYGIEAITLEGFEKTDRGSEADYSQVGKVVESIIRSVNNLLERFHQSFFFYLLPSTDRYISIGKYLYNSIFIVLDNYFISYNYFYRIIYAGSGTNYW